MVKNLSRYNDDALLKLIADDDEKAFEELFDRYWEIAHNVACSKLRSTEMTQEIVHDFFLDIWQRRHALEINNFQHYLKVSIKYKVITQIHQQVSRRKYFEEYRKRTAVSEEHTLMTVEYNDLVKVLEEKMKALPEKTQEIFRLNRLEGRSVSEIASLLNLSEKAIEYHITRSRKELRLLLKDFLALVCVAGSFAL